jgi:Uma2 family endonuclease
MTALTQIPVMSMEDFIEAYGKEPFEFEYGERFPIMAPQMSLSGVTGFEFARYLAGFVDSHRLGRVFSEVPFVITMNKTSWVTGSRTPDIMFYLQERIVSMKAADKEWLLKPIIGAPDFIAEVISPTDKTVEVNRKITGYLRDGVRLIWVIEPSDKTVTVYVQGSNQQTIYSSQTDVLDAGLVIDGFSITLKQLFSSQE